MNNKKIEIVFLIILILYIIFILFKNFVTPVKNTCVQGLYEPFYSDPHYYVDHDNVAFRDNPQTRSLDPPTWGTVAAEGLGTPPTYNKMGNGVHGVGEERGRADDIFFTEPEYNFNVLLNHEVEKFRYKPN